ncbi:hypothetical protein MTO96_005963 [Rhipicephalus appendiculatus]|uniref:Transmembrane protease serine 9-like protein n=1 Tax=Rhipicephalus appendiculatus TaxID=34631 RepID=A0A131Z5J4_RHIAP
MASFQWKFASYICLLLLFCIVYKATAYILNKHDCGQAGEGPGPIQPRIVGGKNAEKARHPWVVNLQAYFVDNRTSMTRVPCGGTLITRWFVLTAARCVLRGLDQGKGSLASIVEVYHSNAEKQKGSFRRARDIIIHPGFNPLTRIHNVALLRLFKRVEKSQLAHPICLMDKRQVLKYKNATVVGWGWITQDIVLRYATVKIVPFKRCQQKLDIIKERKVLTNKTMMCTAGVKRGPCKGDGGGPVTIMMGHKTYQVGIISFPKSCDASRDIPSAHERVDYYFHWIKAVVDYYHKWTWHPPNPVHPEDEHDH